MCLSEASCERNLDDLIESLGAHDTLAADAFLVDKQASGGTVEASKKIHEKPSEPKDEAAAESDDMRELIQEESDKETEEEEGDEEDLQEANSEEEQEEEEEEGLEESDHMPSIEDRSETNIKEAGAEQPAPGLRRRNRPD